MAWTPYHTLRRGWSGRAPSGPNGRGRRTPGDQLRVLVGLYADATEEVPASGLITFFYVPRASTSYAQAPGQGGGLLKAVTFFFLSSPPSLSFHFCARTEEVLSAVKCN